MTTVESVLSQLADDHRAYERSTVAVRIQGDRDYTIADLRERFDVVCNKTNWKLPIDITINHPGETELNVIRQAITWFAGSIASVSPLLNNQVRIKARGYYADIGA